MHVRFLAISDRKKNSFDCETTIIKIYTIPRACSAGLKNTVPADCCERKILFWQDVNSDFVRDKTSQLAGNQPAERPPSFQQAPNKDRFRET